MHRRGVLQPFERRLLAFHLIFGNVDVRRGKSGRRIVVALTNRILPDRRSRFEAEKDFGRIAGGGATS
jgi:hypothetical protein